MASSMLAPIYDAAISNEGSIVLEGLSRGRYHLRMQTQAGVYIKAIRYGGTETTTDSIDVRSGGMKLLVVLAAGSARIEGSVVKPSATETPIVPYYAIVPIRRDHIDSDILFGISDADGTFSAGGLIPGRYSVLAFEALEADAFRNPSVAKALEPFGALVDLQGGTTERITVPVIAAEAAHRVVARARQEAP